MDEKDVLQCIRKIKLFKTNIFILNSLMERIVNKMLIADK
jgi:hypothetical protein